MSQKFLLLAMGFLAAAAVLALTLAALPMQAMAADNDKNNIRCTADPHDPKDGGNAHEPPNSSGNPHFCPPIGQ
jgi:hypothetical protein